MKKFRKFSSIVVIILGVLLIVAGAWGLYFTHKSVVQEKIVTPADAIIANKPVLGPFTLKAQADVIRKHTLETTENKTFAEIPRDNPNRDIWITATTLITALNLAVLAYAFASLTLVVGIAFICIGYLFYKFSPVK